MLPILLYTTLIFWLASLAEVSLLPYWAGDLVFVVLFVWSLFFIGNIEKYRWKIWVLWVPPIFGLGMSSFLFFSYWLLAPYILILASLTYLILRRAKWIFRLREGAFYCLIVFAIFLAAEVLVRARIFNYALTADFYFKYATSFLVGLVAWPYFMLRGRGEKIR